MPVLMACSIFPACGGGGQSSPNDPTAYTIKIDAFPNRQFNQFLPGNRSTIEVDLFTVAATSDSRAFDAGDVQTAGVRFGPGGAAPVSSHSMDVDGDGDQDLRLTFFGPDVGLAADTTQVLITGSLSNGDDFTASDDVNAVTVDPDDPSLPTLVYYASATDSRLMRATMPDGAIVDYEGERDSLGRPMALRNVVRSNPDGSQEYLQLDSSGRATLYEARDGARWTFTWLEGERVLATFRAPNISEEARAVVDLSAGAPFSVKAFDPSGPQRRGRFQAQVQPLSPSRELMGLGTLQTGEVPVLVTRCVGQPVNDALRVEVLFSSGFSTEIRQAELRGNGIYVARVPLGSQFISSLGDVCEGLAKAVAILCETGGPSALAVYMPIICNTVSAAAAPFPPLAAAISTSCPSTILGLELYCETLSQGIPGGPSLGEIICASLNGTIDSAIASDNLLSARAIVTSPLGTGTTTHTSEVLADVPIPGPMPQLSIALGSTTELNDATTSPLDPAPLQSYSFSVSVGCVPTGGVTVVLSISGTDGYQNSSATFLSTDGVASLNVPGALDGVVDTLRAVVFQYQGGAILDEVTFSITF